MKIKALHALEILDSRGRPTIKAYCQLASGAYGEASIPSGASTGKAEAHELRDRDSQRYNGMGVLQAVNNINTEISNHLKSMDVPDQASLDDELIKLDGTEQKMRLGANAILAVSIAFSRACAIEHNQPLYEHLSEMMHHPIIHLPRPTINLFSGGKHAGGQVPVQDLLIVPAQDDISNCLDTTYRVYQSAAKLCLSKYQMRSLTADEGGLAPPFPNLETMFDDALKSIENAGYRPGEDVYFAMDVASSHFYVNGAYDLGSSILDSESMIQEILSWTKKYPLISVEDGLAEEDWDHWPALMKQINQDHILVLGDDFLCTNPNRIKRAIKLKAANSLLLKVNQIGTLTEAMEAYQLAKGAGWNVTVSARSGETEDNWLADLAVGWQGDQIKIGSITQSERLAKYNRLLEIEEQTKLPVISWPN